MAGQAPVVARLGGLARSTRRATDAAGTPASKQRATEGDREVAQMARRDAAEPLAATTWRLSSEYAERTSCGSSMIRCIITGMTASESQE